MQKELIERSRLFVQEDVEEALPERSNFLKYPRKPRKKVAKPLDSSAKTRYDNPRPKTPRRIRLAA
jgi:hypothetical protein